MLLGYLNNFMKFLILATTKLSTRIWLILITASIWALIIAACRTFFCLCLDVWLSLANHVCVVVQVGEPSFFTSVEQQLAWGRPEAARGSVGGGLGATSWGLM